MEQLPDDMLADVLGRLPPSSLAASRCVRKHWCSIIDTHRLLRADLLPLRLDAFYCTSLDCIARLTYLLARAAPAIPGGCLDFLEGYYGLEVVDHCNGLLLLCGSYMVVNPATRQWAKLPPSPEPESSIGDMLGGLSVWAGTMTGYDQENDYYHNLLDSSFYLVYDPMAESAPQQQHFEVFLIPFLASYDLARNQENITIHLDEQEWPPSTLRIHVFSSRRWRWEERSWIRQGEPAGTMADMMQCDDCREYKAVYFQGALYVHCQNHSVMRIALSNDKYQMIPSPATLSKLGVGDATFYLGKSEKGVYFALLDKGSFPRFRVWFLKEEEEINDDGNRHIIHMEWVLKTNISLPPLLAAHKLALLHRGFADDEWRVIDNYNNNKKEEVPSVGDNKFTVDEWDFDNADIVLGQAADNKATVEADEHYPVDNFLGFHPYKEIVFFCLRSGTISYNLNTSKIQQLGGRIHIPVGMRSCFPYTSCLLRLGESFENS